MRDLFYKAREYGRVSLITAKDDTYYCTITSDTSERFKFEVDSGAPSVTAEEALQAAIDNARVIVASFVDDVAKFTQLVKE